MLLSKQSATGSRLRQNDWYTERFLPKMREFRKGALVWDWKDIKGYAADETMRK